MCFTLYSEVVCCRVEGKGSGRLGGGLNLLLKLLRSLL